MLIINFEGREVKGLSKGRYDETFAGEDGEIYKKLFHFFSYYPLQVHRTFDVSKTVTATCRTFKLGKLTEDNV